MLNKYKWSVKIRLRMKRNKEKIKKSRIDDATLFRPKSLAYG
jgi:hypothetical protein